MKNKMNLSRVKKDLINTIRLSDLEADVFIHVTINGKMDAAKLAEELNIDYNTALEAARNLVKLGGFIDISSTEFEAMHPRFTAVNMYRRMCKRENIEFKKNTIVDNIGVILETYYESRP